MRYCPNCGSQAAENASFCTNCGARLEPPANQQTMFNGQPYPQQNAQPFEQPNGQPYSQQPYAQPPYAQPPAPQDTGRLLYGVIGFFIPVVGIILYVFWKNERPLDAKRAGKGALISIILSVLCSVILTILSFFFAANGVIDGDVSYNFSLLSSLIPGLM